MKHLLTLLIVTVLGGGGPPGVKPHRLADSVITVTKEAECGGVTAGHPCSPPGPFPVARSSSGKLTVHLRPGAYHVRAAVLTPDGFPGQTCQEKPVRVRRGRTTRVYLYCSIK